MIIETCIFAGCIYAGVNIFRKTKEQKTNQKHSVQEKNSDIAIDNTGLDGPQIDRLLKVSGISCGLAAAGIMFPLLMLCSIPGLVYCTVPYFKKSWKLLKQKKAGVDTLLALTFGGSLFFGLIFLGNIAVFFSIVALKLHNKVTEGSKASLINIFDKKQEHVWAVIDNTEVMVPFVKIKTGDILVINSGEIIPADGKILQGSSIIDQRILTGESNPVERLIGDEVFASTSVLSGKILIKVEKAGQDTLSAKIEEILKQTAACKSEIQLRSERLADKTVLPIIVLGGLSIPFIGTSGAVGVINSHFKEKMRIIGSLGTMCFFKAASNGSILIKDGRSLDALSHVDTIVFDKTGTLTQNEPEVGDIFCLNDYKKEDIIMYAAMAEYRQSHPIAKAILKEIKKQNIMLPNNLGAEYRSGLGVTVKIQEKTIYVGSVRFMHNMGLDIPEDIEKALELCRINGTSSVIVAIEKEIAGLIEIRQTLRLEAREVINSLRNLPNIKYFHIISGDQKIPTKKLADTLEIDSFFAETLPEEKAEIIDRLKKQGRVICYVGDGLNDSIAMQKSDVSVSLSGASTAATDTAKIILMDQGLTRLPALFYISKKFRDNMNISFGIVVGQTVFCLAGVFLLGMGLGYTIILNTAAFAAGTVNAMTPLLLNIKDVKSK